MSETVHVVDLNTREWIYGSTFVDGVRTTTWQRLKTDAEKAKDSLDFDDLTEEERKRCEEIIAADAKAIRRSKNSA